MTAKQDIKIGVTGAGGRMGGLIARELQDGAGAGPGLVFAGSIDRDDDPRPLFTAADVIIDFTTPESSLAYAALGKPMVIGTTGLNAAQENALAVAAKKSAIVYAANMSIGVNLLLALVEQAAAKLGPDWDIQIAEVHHRHKKDAPSGTALALGRAAFKALSPVGRGLGEGVSSSAQKLTAPSPYPLPTGERDIREEKIGYAVQRGGDVVGEHAVSFFGAGERVVLSHIATDRALFARGAIQAARWVVDQPPGLYGMRQVLGL